MLGFLGCLFHGEKLDVKDESGVLGNTRQVLRAICKRSRDSESALTSDLHANNTQIPALDNFTASKAKVKRLARDVLVKDLAVLQLSNVTHTNLLQHM